MWFQLKFSGFFEVLFPKKIFDNISFIREYFISEISYDAYRLSKKDSYQTIPKCPLNFTKKLNDSDNNIVMLIL